MKQGLHDLLERELKRALSEARYEAAESCMERLDALMRANDPAKIDAKALLTEFEALSAFVAEARVANNGQVGNEAPLPAFLKLFDAQVAYLNGRYEEAERHAQMMSFAASAALREMGAVIVGASQIAQGKRYAARLTFTSALAVDGDSPEANLRMGHAYFTDRSFEEALAYLTKAASLAEEALDESAALRAKALAATVYFKQRKFKNALQALSGYPSVGGFPFERLRRGALVARIAIVAQSFGRNLSIVESAEVDEIDRMIEEAYFG